MSTKPLCHVQQHDFVYAGGMVQMNLGDEGSWEAGMADTKSQEKAEP